MPTDPPWILTHRDHLGPLRVRLNYRLAGGARRGVVVDREHDTPAQVAAIGEALAAGNVVTKGEAVRRGWRSTT